MVSELLVTNVPLVREMVTKLVEGRAVSFSLYRSIVVIRLFCCLALLVAFVLPAAADTPTIDIDGQFNTTSSHTATAPQSGSQEITPLPGAQIPLWTVTSGSVDWISALWNVPPGVGGWSVDLNGNGPDEFTSTVQLDPGEYLLSFYLTGDPRLNSAQRSVNVIAGLASNPPFTVTPLAPQVDPSISPVVNWGDLDWTLQTLQFSVRAGSRNTIAFQSLTTNDPVVGNVSLTKTGEVPVPEAGFYSAFALNLAGLLLFVRRRRSGGFRSQYCSSGKWRKLRRMKQLCGVAS